MASFNHDGTSAFEIPRFFGLIFDDLNFRWDFSFWIFELVLTVMVPAHFEIPRFFRWVFEDFNFRCGFSFRDFGWVFDDLILEQFLTTLILERVLIVLS